MVQGAYSWQLFRSKRLHSARNVTRLRRLVKHRNASVDFCSCQRLSYVRTLWARQARRARQARLAKMKLSTSLAFLAPLASLDRITRYASQKRATTKWKETT